MQTPGDHLQEQPSVVKFLSGISHPFHREAIPTAHNVMNPSAYMQHMLVKLVHNDDGANMEWQDGLKHPLVDLPKQIKWDNCLKISLSDSVIYVTHHTCRSLWKFCRGAHGMDELVP